MTPPKEPVFGIAMRNFTKYPEMPSAAELIDYGVLVEELGYESVWAWDHILLGVVPSFPIHEALTILTAIAARTCRALGTRKPALALGAALAGQTPVAFLTLETLLALRPRLTGRARLALLTGLALWTSRPNEPGAKPEGNRQLAMQIAQRMARDAGKQQLSSFTGSSADGGSASANFAGGPPSKQDEAKLGREQTP